MVSSFVQVKEEPKSQHSKLALKVIIYAMN